MQTITVDGDTRVVEKRIPEDEEFKAILGLANNDIRTIRTIAPVVHLVDASSHDPAGYRFLDYDTRSQLDGGKDYTGLVLGDYPNPVFSEYAQRTYKVGGYSEVYHTRSGFGRRYKHAVVPIGGERLIVAARYQNSGLGTRLLNTFRARHIDKADTLKFACRWEKLSVKAEFGFRIAIDGRKPGLDDAFECLADNQIALPFEGQAAHHAR